MLSIDENELLCQVGPGTPMGNLMRQYWIPALKSDELPSPDCPPIRTRLLGENLIAFRVTSGAVGFIANSCPHRGASLFFGRNEEEGLRCVYHGWKFDVDGNCVDMPSEPAESNFKSKVKATTYAAKERNGVIWAYMGPRETPPALPDLEANMLGDGQYNVSKTQRECNWMQALEGDIDTVHSSFLHHGAETPETEGTADLKYKTGDRAARYIVAETEFGNCYGAYRPAEDDQYYWRIANFLFPFYTMVPSSPLDSGPSVRLWVPLDDGHTMYWSMSGRSRNAVGGSATRARLRGETPPEPATQYVPHTSDWLGRYRLAGNRDNDYMINRDVQRSDKSEKGYTGLASIFLQDQAITESMGPIYRRQNEHLGTSDSMIIRVRRRLINAAKALRDNGTVPPGAETPEVYRQRSGWVILPRGADWLEATAELRHTFRGQTEEAAPLATS
jgi:phenylpropionate dioxygenase-like ring-hydroxylating dioxygenase large terminal subunit